MSLDDFYQRIRAYQDQLRKLSDRELWREWYRLFRMWKKGRPTGWRLKELKKEVNFREVT